MFVIAGVSGNTGSIVAEELLARGKKVRVVVRDAKKAQAWRDKGAEIAVASLDDAGALAKALAGAEGAYLLSPPDLGASDFLALRKKTASAIAEAVETSRVPHVVFLSSIGAQHQTGNGIIASVAYAERRLAKTDAKLTFVRAGSFLENWAGVLGAAKAGVLPTFVPAALAVPSVAARDIGQTGAAALLEGPPAEKTRILELAGPADYTANDVAAVLAKILGKPVAVQEAPLSAVVPTYTGYGMSANVAELFRGMYEGFIDGTVAWEGGKAQRVRGKTDAETLFRQLLG